MPLRSSALPAFVCLLLAACGAGPPAERVEQLNLALDELRGELRDVRALVAESVAKPGWVAPQLAPQAAREPAASLESNARLARLGDRLDVLLQMLASAPPKQVRQPAEASSGARTIRSSSAAPASIGARIQVLQSALQVAQRQCELHVENIASVNVCGYKKRAMQLSTELDEASGLRLPVAARVVLLHTTGALEITERTLDVAIDGPGFLIVQEPDGTARFTRAGNLHLDASGQIVSACGLPLVPAIALPADVLEVGIDARGVVSGRTVAHPDRSTRFGRIQLAGFGNAAGLELLPHNRFAATPASGASRCGAPGTAGLGVLKQGFLERSNVQIADEVIRLQVLERQCVALRRALAGLGVFVP